MTKFVYPYECDWSECENTPTGHPGDIYYACEEHFEEFREWLA